MGSIYNKLKAMNLEDSESGYDETDEIIDDLYYYEDKEKTYAKNN
jgi:hypothetical protein